MRPESDANVLNADNQPELPFEQSEGRCGSCGGPAVDNELCPACREAFRAVLGDATAPAPDGASPVATEPVPAPSNEAFVAAPAAVVAGVAAPVASVAANVASVADQSVVADRPRGMRPELVAVIVVAVAAVVGIPFGASWLRDRSIVQTASVTVMAEPVSAAAKTAVAQEAPVVAAPAPPAAPARPTTVEAESPSLPPAVPAARPSTAAPARSLRAAAAPKKAELPSKPSRPVAPALDLSAMRVATLVPPASMPQPPVPEPQHVQAEAPAGRLFDMSEVDEPPRVATKVDPHLPGELAGRPVNDVVVVRILVSQTGHPFRVSLLRRSKLGSSVDEAVVAAVKQWTFSPARKRGDVVSCWYNFGVSLAN